jgi:predicted enzyme related to lactoylglutathione lyase
MPDNNTFIWNELITLDQRTSGNFYSQLLGWDRKEVDAGPQGTYTLFQQNGKDVAGMMNPTIDYTRNLGARWYGYVAVEDMNERMARVKKLGGKIIAGPDDIPGVGLVCLLADPTGALIRLMQPAAAPK